MKGRVESIQQNKKCDWIVIGVSALLQQPEDKKMNLQSYTFLSHWVAVEGKGAAWRKDSREREAQDSLLGRSMSREGGREGDVLLLLQPPSSSPFLLPLFLFPLPHCLVTCIVIL